MSRKEEKKNQAIKTIMEGGVPEGDLKFYTGNREGSKDRDVGETWTDEDGNFWEQKDGYRIKHPKVELFNMPMFCPECDQIMNKRLDDKMWYKKNKCFDCVIKEETRMRAEGTYELYEKKNMLSNMKSYLRDLEQGAQDFYNNINNQNMVNEFGVEEWSEMSDDQIQEMKERTEGELDKLRSQIKELEKEVQDLHSESGENKSSSGD